MDTDKDGITDALETLSCTLYSSLPHCSVSALTGVLTTGDVDGDGIKDAAEVKYGKSPFDVNNPRAGGSGDSDLDGISDAVESYACSLYPALAHCSVSALTGLITTGDADGDGLPDALEISI